MRAAEEELTVERRIGARSGPKIDCPKNAHRSGVNERDAAAEAVGDPETPAIGAQREAARIRAHRSLAERERPDRGPLPLAEGDLSDGVPAADRDVGKVAVRADRDRLLVRGADA